MTSYLFLADGFEEIEAITTVDVLRRAGMALKTVSINSTHRATGAHNVDVEADLMFKQADFGDCEWLILPGGMPGASNLAAFRPLTELIKVHAENGRKVAAICASPAVVLAPLGVLSGRKATCYPGFEGALKDADAVVTAGRAVVDGNIVTSNGPSSATDFALAIVAESKGRGVANEVAGGMLV